MVFVIHKNGKKLMPCSNAIARLLLKQGRAKVKKLTPFTIQLVDNSTEYVQNCTVGIDKGSKFTGVSVVANGKVLLSAIINHRGNIKDKMDERRALRRARRNRLEYRAPRFNNRGSSKRTDRLAPSIKANIDEVLRVINKIPLPINHVVVEDVMVDIAKLNDKTLKGVEYQQPKRLNENLRLATLMRDRFTCKACSAKNTKLEAHHIIFRSQGGKDTLDNLITLCSSCHKKVHSGKITLDAKGVSKRLDAIAQHTMQGKAILYRELAARYGKLDKMFGYETAMIRNELNLAKDHDIDAYILALSVQGDAEYNRNNFYQINFRARQTRKLYYTLPRKGLGRIKYQVNEELCGFRKGDIVLVTTKSGQKFRKQINSIYSSGVVAFKRVKGEPPSALPKNCSLLEKCTTINWCKS